MVAPLFNAAIALLEYEPSATHITNLERVWRSTFKHFMLISKRTSSLLVNEMIGKDLRETAHRAIETCKRQWAERCQYQEISSSLPSRKALVGLRGVPNSWCELVNTMVRPCPQCKLPGIVTNRWHLLTKHGIKLPTVNYIWRNEVLPRTQELIYKNKQNGVVELKLTDRTTIRETLKPVLDDHLKRFSDSMGILMSSVSA